MTGIEDIEPFEALPNRLAVADFNPLEVEKILGRDVTHLELAKSNFNWIGAYLVEQVGLHEQEVAEWFKSGAHGLDGKRPIDVWSKENGFEAVFDYAKQWKTDVDEVLTADYSDWEESIFRSHEIGRSALGIILMSFAAANVDLTPVGDPRFTSSYTIWNPEKEDSMTVRWKGSKSLEDYRIHQQTDEREQTYYIVRYCGEGDDVGILQTGIVERIDGKMQETDSDSDINGRAPSAGEVANFVIPLANEIKNRSLRVLEPARQY